MRFVLGILIPLTAALLQGTVAPLIAVGGARPSLPILVAASWSIAAGAREGVWWAFLGGLASDLKNLQRAKALQGNQMSTWKPLAACSILCLPFAACTTVQGPIIAGAVLVGLATVAAGLIYIGILAVTGEAVSSLPLAAGATVASALYTGLLAVAIYPVARLLRRATEKQGALGVW